ncbi:MULTISPECIES: LysR family transcriptional regulator [Pseudomonadota]|uniref:LysR family transcriptional regulator n=1 Tax=Pseudomonadota TaxID=1224 RepID=UPI0008A59097|nr:MULTISPECIES: LysR substrate-binding domain-containing protein [Pseudomonadota]MBJ9965608.1 LysR family transcriptional regulator [Burkholderia seminalis]MDN7586821.1 LysR substrate-binding domain-containing protein [Burkholderia seminalis]OFU89058.1 D-alanyl-D-alanine endopeptidase [Stenotrophomonas sp. HMSC10F07]
MELRHLRYFARLAEELHFTRAAERLHIEQPPLSRAIKELEGELGVVLFNRDRRGTQLTPAGLALLQDVRRLFALLEQTRENVRAVAEGLRGSVRLAISDGAFDRRLSSFLAHCREEEPDIEVRLSEVSLAEQLKGLRSGYFLAGLAHTAEVGDEILAQPLWQAPLIVAMPQRHPLLANKRVPLIELTCYPLVLYDPHMFEGYYRELDRLLHSLEWNSRGVEHASSLDMMLTLVSAGYGIGFTTAARMAVSQRPDIVVRPLALDSAMITTYLLQRRSGRPHPTLERLVVRLRSQDVA